ncbi:MAG: AI-2E family transporter [Salinibacter sp.]
MTISAFLDGFRRRVRGTLLFGGVGVLLYLLWDIAQLFLFAGLIAYLLDPLVRRFQRPMGRTSATLLVLGLLIVGGIGIGIGVKPVIEQQVAVLRTSVQPEQVWDVVRYLEGRLSALSVWLGGDPVNLGLKQQLIGMLSQEIGSQLFSKVQGVLSIAMNVVVIPFLAVFLLRDGPQIKRGLIRLVPNRYFEFSLEALHKIDLRLGGYLRGIVVQNSIVSGLAIGTLWVLNVPGFLLLGLLVGLTNFVPYIGPLIGGSVVVLVQLASTGSTHLAGLVLLALLGIQLLDEALIVPVVCGQAVDLHPLEVLLALWVAAQFFGLLGVVVAIPVASGAKVIFTEATALIQQYRFSPTPN